MSEILINQLFAGSYLQEGTNIGHEIINIFRDDNDENYLFITPYGNVMVTMWIRYFLYKTLKREKQWKLL